MISFNTALRTTTLSNTDWVTSDLIRQTVLISLDDIPVAIDSGATVTASVLSTDHVTEIIGAVTCSNVAEGADWQNGFVTIEFNGSQTDVETYGPAHLLIRIKESGEQSSYFALIYLIRGVSE